MLHLVPFGRLIQFIFAGTVLLTTAVSWVLEPPADGEWPASLILLRFSAIASTVIVIALYLVWRFVKPVQNKTFPYIAGTWSGTLEYQTATGASGTKAATLEVEQGLEMHLRLTTDESTSRTLAVVPERDATFGDFKLYYVYSVERTRGVGADRVYRGTAILRVTASDSMEISGDYFTEHRSRGQVRFKPTPSLSVVRRIRRALGLGGR